VLFHVLLDSGHDEATLAVGLDAEAIAGFNLGLGGNRQGTVTW
jgi:hypothetical protein